jgi:hypothetical protein
MVPADDLARAPCTLLSFRTLVLALAGAVSGLSLALARTSSVSRSLILSQAHAVSRSPLLRVNSFSLFLSHHHHTNPLSPHPYSLPSTLTCMQGERERERDEGREGGREGGRECARAPVCFSPPSLPLSLPPFSRSLASSRSLPFSHRASLISLRSAAQHSWREHTRARAHEILSIQLPTFPPWHWPTAQSRGAFGHTW